MRVAGGMEQHMVWLVMQVHCNTRMREQGWGMPFSESRQGTFLKQAHLEDHLC